MTSRARLVAHRQHGKGGRIWAEGGNWRDYATSSPAPRVFLVKENDPYTLLAVMLTFGLHGPEPAVMQRLRPVIVLPDHWFGLPLVANVCQWLGGVPFDPATLSAVVRERAIVMVMPGPLGVYHSDGDDDDDDNDIDDSSVNRHRGPDDKTNARTWSQWLLCHRDHTVPMLITPVVYKGARSLYWTVGPLRLGLCFTCIPRVSHIRAGVGIAIATHSDEGIVADDDVLAARINQGHQCLEAALQ